jgi:hypothetical protein
MMKLSGCMSKSTEIMQAMNQLVKLKDMKETMGDMAREMEKVPAVRCLCQSSERFSLLDGTY